MSLPQKLQEYRRTEKLSQEELANRLGVSRQSVSKWEQGLSFPETEKLIELSTMMGLTIDSLLKDTPTEPDPIPPAAPESAEPTVLPQPSFLRRHWLTILLAVLLALTTLALLLPLPGENDPPLPHESIPQSEPEPSTTAPPETETEPAPTETVPIPTDPGFITSDLDDLQRWFFDFARDYRLDYMPQFTREEGPPTVSDEYLYWAFAINLDNWGAEKGTMRASYVNDTVYAHFRTLPHPQGNEGWTYDNTNEVYTAKPGGIKELHYYLLTGIEIRNGEYTVHATRYYSRFIYLSPEEELQLRDAMISGNTMDLMEASELTVTFILDPNNDYEPIFYAYDETFLTEFMS